MSDLDLLRNAVKEPASASPRARARARAKLTDKIDASERRRWRPSLLPLAGVVTTLAVALGVFLSIGGGGSQDTAAAAVLRHAAKAALEQPGLDTLKPGQYIYTKSVDAYLNTTVISGPESSFSVLVPHAREIWINRNWEGWLHETSGTPKFLSERDRQRWIAAGRPDLSGGVTDMPLENQDGSTSQMQSLDLPTDPDALYSRLENDARGHGSGLYTEMYTLVGDNLRENFVTPAQRAALYEVAARLPGVELVGDVTDSAGRAGIAIAMVDEDKIREALVFDRASYELLGEEQIVMSGNPWGYPAGTVIGHATYLKQAVVDALKKRP